MSYSEFARALREGVGLGGALFNGCNLQRIFKVSRSLPAPPAPPALPCYHCYHCPASTASTPSTALPPLLALPCYHCYHCPASPALRAANVCFCHSQASCRQSDENRAKMNLEQFGTALKMCLAEAAAADDLMAPQIELLCSNWEGSPSPPRSPAASLIGPLRSQLEECRLQLNAQREATARQKVQRQHGAAEVMLARAELEEMVS